jgi:hypothetical protein
MVYMAWETFLMERAAGPMNLPPKATATGIPAAPLARDTDTSVQ